MKWRLKEQRNERTSLNGNNPAITNRNSPKIDEPLAYWIPELEKLAGTFAMVHSKVIVLDPTGEYPVVMTGSHNMGPKASEKNDDNLVIVQGNRDLALQYAVNIVSIYNQYRWRFLLHTQKDSPAHWDGLQDNDTWQNEVFSGVKLREINFWLG